MTIATSLIQEEIVRLHFFFEDWFNGTSPHTEAAFSAFSDALAPSFVHVGPGGNISDRQDLINHLAGMYGARPGIRISIHNPKIHRSDPELIIATYEEWQTYDYKDTKRLSSVTMTFEEPNLIWQHVHESWLSGPNVPANEA